MAENHTTEAACLLEQGAAYRRRKFEEVFEAPLRKVMDEAKKPEEGNCSPIAEVIVEVLTRAEVKHLSGPTRLVFFSDMAQNSPIYSAFTRTKCFANNSQKDHTVDGRPLPAAEVTQYVLLHKPSGFVTTVSDPEGRPVVTDLVGTGSRLYPIGRLDWDVEGVLLLTNDGPLTHRLPHPRYALPRVYEAEVAGRVARVRDRPQVL